VHAIDEPHGECYGERDWRPEGVDDADGEQDGDEERELEQSAERELALLMLGLRDVFSLSRHCYLLSSGETASTRSLVFAG
jgi:hypothetical protein